MKINTEVRYGIYLGIAMCLYTVLMWLTGLDTKYLATGQYLDIAVVVLPLCLTFLAIRQRSKETDLTILKRIKCGLIVNFVSFLIYAPFLSIYHHFINQDWLKYVLALKEKELTAQAVAPETITETLNGIAASSNDFNFIISGLIAGVLIFGLVFSLLTIPFIRSRAATRISLGESNILLPFNIICLILLSVIFTQSTPAIVIRHDRKDAQYIKLGKKYESAYCRINIPDGGGSLIAPEWILTAAHIATEIKSFPHKVQCGNSFVEVEKVFINPGYIETIGRNDIALLKLVKPVKNIKPVPIYTEKDEAMQTAILLGHFTTGNGKTGPDKTLKMTLRGATNRIEKTNDFWLYFNFDSPDSPGVTDLEGTPGAGDSGTPAYLNVGGKLYVAGIGSRSLDTNKNGIEPDYGDTDLYTRVSSYSEWIISIINAKPLSQLSQTVEKSDLPTDKNVINVGEENISAFYENLFGPYHYITFRF